MVPPLLLVVASLTIPENLLSADAMMMKSVPLAVTIKTEDMVIVPLAVKVVTMTVPLAKTVDMVTITVATVTVPPVKTVVDMVNVVKVDMVVVTVKTAVKVDMASVVKVDMVVIVKTVAMVVVTVKTVVKVDMVSVVRENLVLLVSLVIFPFLLALHSLPTLETSPMMFVRKMSSDSSSPLVLPAYA